MIQVSQRSRYYHQFDSLRAKGMLIVITGQRRTGKSTFLSLLAQQHTTLSIDFELLQRDGIKTYQTLQTTIVDSLGQISVDLVTIDEIQVIPQREKAVLSLIKEYPQITFVVTGSNSHLLASDLTTNLRGRYSHIHLYPFGFAEYCESLNSTVSLPSFESFVEQGGFPSLYALDTPQAQRERSQTLINTIFIKDIIERYAIRQPQLLREIFLYLVFNAGNLTNISSISDYLTNKKVTTNRNTVAEYIDYLIQAYMIYPVQVYDLKGKKIFDRMIKYYPSDHSRRKTLFGSYDPGNGKILETIVLFACLRYGWDVRVGRIGDREIDFIITKGSQKKYLQVAYLLSSSEVVDREFGNLKQLSDHYPKYVISLDPLAWGNSEGIEHIRARELDDILTERKT